MDMDTYTAFASLKSSEWRALSQRWNTDDDHTYVRRFQARNRQNQSLLARALIRRHWYSAGKADDALHKPIDLQSPGLSIAHRKDTVGIAVNDHVLVGIDVEDTAQDRNFKALAESIFSGQSTPLSVYADAAQFYKFWTGWEASIKACRHKPDAQDALLASDFWRFGDTVKVILAGSILSITWHTMEPPYLWAIAELRDL
ncbi:MAG: hypothetical protein WD407_12450 [Rhodospirillales bacterium]